eukprot:5555425-Prymnesium_polylepis.1
MAWRAVLPPVNGDHGISGNRGKAPRHDRAGARVSRPTWRVRRLRSDHLSAHTSDGGPYAAG